MLCIYLKEAFINNYLLLVLLGCFGIMPTGNALAKELWAPMDAGELRALPPYCIARVMEKDKVGWQAGVARFGKGWDHLHHYCYALNWINRYNKTFDQAARKFYLQNAIGDMDYVFKNTAPDFFLRPEIHVQKGKLFAAAKRNIEAAGEFEQALQDNPNYVEAYVALSDYYKNNGQQSKSIAVVQQALQRVPNNKSLQKRYNQLTGKIFTPPPLTVEQDAQIPPTVIPAVQAAATSGVNSATTQPVPVSSPVAVPEKIGTPSNPYCRFCPPD
jgi:tetratricopeptide (TPR) repeat protein